jgi:hypothetical protein
MGSQHPKFELPLLHNFTLFLHNHGNWAWALKLMFFFLESAGELRIILIREEKRSKMDQGTKP